MPRASRKHETDERELRADGDHGRRTGQLAQQHPDEHHAECDRQDVAGPREEDERVLGAQPKDLVEDSRRCDVGRPDPVLRDHVGMSDGND